MMLLAGPFYAASALLVAAGGLKIVDPKPLARALSTLSLRLPHSVLRVGAALEVGIGLMAVLRGDRLSAVLVAASYTAFTVVVLVALRRGGVLASCGCFGKRDLPPTRMHALLTATFAGVALTGAPGPFHHADALPALAVAVGALAVCSYLALAVLPLLAVERAR